MLYKEDFWIGIIGLVMALTLMFGVPYGSYRYGRFAERRLLTQAFMQTMEQDYYIGYGAAEADCRAGLIK